MVRYWTLLIPLAGLIIMPFLFGTADAAIGTKSVPQADTSHLSTEELAKLQLQANADSAAGQMVAAAMVALMFGGVIAFVVYLVWNSA